ncbi:LysR family transcriptional regulator [Paludibacterium paludis]|uniref:LysR family transcriptional regulator n=1 Tax=Paludibacterium paludis TaxID=1225769 RepID=A0A918P4E3_9NEIS|nr:LysR family transcriptional regulator [Paludibacterium paludis]GGY18374.1 LysR family transcriptional regulator [Paludibacterium paludis]
MNTTETLRIFTRVAELSSFTQAADSLGLPKASVSSAVRALESQLGTRLFFRTTRRVELTPDGQACYERGKDLLADLDDLMTLFQHADASLSGRLRVDMPAGVARNLVIPKLPDFLEAHPRLALELGCADRKVDIVREGFDCVLRVGKLADSSLAARQLGAFRQINCASPAYLERYGTPTHLADLSRHRMVHYTASLGARPSGWEYTEGAEEKTHPVPGALTVNSTDAYDAACLAGLGLIQAPEAGVAHWLRSGQLVEVMREWRPAPIPVALVFTHRRHLPRRVRVFMDWIGEVLRPALA